MRLLRGKTQESLSYLFYNIGVDTVLDSEQNLNFDFSNFNRNEIYLMKLLKSLINKILLFHFLKMIDTSISEFRQ